MEDMMVTRPSLLPRWPATISPAGSWRDASQNRFAQRVRQLRYAAGDAGIWGFPNSRSTFACT